MRILTVSCFSPWWCSYQPDVLDADDGGTVGGGEEAFLRTAVGLRALGHEVLAYHYGLPGVWKGVEFRGPKQDLYGEITKGGFDAVIAWSGLRPLEAAEKGTRRLFAQQLNDLWTVGDWNRVDCVVSPSASHAEQVVKWGWKGERTVVHNGIVPELYGRYPLQAGGSGYGDFQPHVPWSSRPLHVGYWSSPDRGLHHLLRAWPLVTRELPKAHLHVFYEIKRYLALSTQITAGFFSERAVQLRTLLTRAASDSTITFHGAVPRKKLAKTQLQCRVMAYPYDPFGYCEGFAISVAQGLAAGCTVLTTSKDAMPSLYGDGVYWLHDDFLSDDYYEYLAGRVVGALNGDVPKMEEARALAPSIALKYTWDAAAKQMEAACKGRG